MIDYSIIFQIHIWTTFGWVCEHNAEDQRSKKALQISNSQNDEAGTNNGSTNTSILFSTFNNCSTLTNSTYINDF